MDILDALCIADVSFALVGQVFSSETVARQDEAKHNLVHWYQRGARAEKAWKAALLGSWRHSNRVVCRGVSLQAISLAFLQYPVKVLVIFVTLVVTKLCLYSYSVFFWSIQHRGLRLLELGSGTQKLFLKSNCFHQKRENMCM